MKEKSEYQEILKADQNNAQALHMLGVLHTEEQDFEGAITYFEKALAQDFENPTIYFSYGNALKGAGKSEQALEKYRVAQKLNTQYSQAYANAGVVLHELGSLPEALVQYEKALELNPAYAEVYSNRGALFKETGRLEEALQSYQRAIDLKPDYADAYYNRANLLESLQKLDLAIESFNKAIELHPGHVSAQWNRSLALLLAGDLTNGWKHFEWRWRTAGFRAHVRQFTQPLWLGQELLVGKTILLYGEQGLGDTLQFSRYVSLVAAMGAKVLLEVERPLMEVMRTIDGVSHLIERGAPLPDFDYQCPLMSLPLAFETSLNTIPSRDAYLRSDPSKAAHWEKKLGAREKLRVGVVWSGGFRPEQPELWAVNGRRNIELKQLAALKMDGVHFYSLQKGAGPEAELALLKQDGWDGPDLIDYAADLHDFSDTAALIENLDLVISVDTSTAHLAAALGKPVWLMNRFDTCWRWLLHREDSPWYPSLKIYRQKTSGDWSGVIEQITAELSDITAPLRQTP